MAERKRTDDRRRSDDRRRAPRAPENENAENILEGRNALSEALSSGRTVDKVFIAEGSTDRALARLAAKVATRGSAGSARLGLEAWRAHRELERGKPVRVFREDEL